MKKNEKHTAIQKILAVTLCLAVMLSLAGCGGDNPSGSQNDSYKIKAEFDPYQLHPGLAAGSDWTTADVWYPVDSPDSMPMYLTYGYEKGYDDCLFVITWMDEEGYDYVDCLTEASGMDLVSMAGEEQNVDFIFSDALTAYDKKSGTKYSRATDLSYEELTTQLGGVTFVNGRGNGSFTFNEDGSAVQTYEGIDYAGDWLLTAATVVTYFDEQDPAYDNNLQILQDSQGIYLATDSGYYYPQESEAEDAA